ncbi:hypothetical protein, partial [Ulvibacter litoralis]
CLWHLSIEKIEIGLFAISLHRFEKHDKEDAAAIPGAKKKRLTSTKTAKSSDLYVVFGFTS